MKDTVVPIIESCKGLNDDSTFTDVANKFIKYFTIIGPELKMNMLNESLPIIPACPHSRYLYRTSEDEVSKIIGQLQNKHSSGTDEISNVILKISAPITIYYLVELINKSFQQSDQMKKCKIIAIDKGESKLVESNYRLISLLIVWSKIFERAMFNRIYRYTERFGVINCNQHGFRKKQYH